MSVRAALSHRSKLMTQIMEPSTNASMVVGLDSRQTKSQNPNCQKEKTNEDTKPKSIRSRRK